MSGTPGLYPERYSTDAAFIAQHATLAAATPANAITYSFRHLGGTTGLADASRYVGDLQPGQCETQYWHFTYPQCSEADRVVPCSGVPTWGDSVKPQDDLWLNFDIWAKSSSTVAGTQVFANQTWTMTMRNEISAMANKIEPNPLGQWFILRICLPITRVRGAWCSIPSWL